MAANPARRWYQFSLRALLVLMVISSVPPAVHVGYKRYLVAKRLAEIESSFRWLESLGYPQLTNAGAIRITTKYWYGKQDPGKAQTGVELGFLLSEDAKSFSAFTPSLQVITLERQSREEWPKSDSEFERVDAQTLARLALGRLKAQDSDPFYRFGNDCSARCELFVLAWAFARQGHSDWAIKLYEQAEKGQEPDDKSGDSFQERLAADIGHLETWRATVACGTQVPRAELLRKFRWIQQHYPNSKHAATVSEKVAILEQMVVEDERYAQERHAGLPFEQLPKSEQISELIFQLRDQNGVQFSQPGWCDVLWTRDGKEDSPGHQLLAFGYDAVPQVAAALSDERLSRSVGYHRNFYFSHTVLTVGDAAKQILERIASRRFDDGKEYDCKAARTEAIRKAVLAWHSELLAKGERAYLIEAVERGDETSVDLAHRLLEKYPDEGCLAIVVAIPRTKDAYQRHRLLEMLGRVPSDASVPFLLDAVQHETLGIRVSAAQALTDLGRPEGIEAMLRQWQSSEQVTELQGVGPFLASCGSEEAIDAVAQRFSEQSIGQRIETMEKAVEDENNVLVAKPELRNAVIKLLLVALADTDVRSGMSGSYGDKSFSNPRVCDLAGYHLNCLDATAFCFDLSQPINQREAARLAILAAH